tara:strand:+ start:452 stop:715 length:264 start_codon:yes stop_codon:yes gene_type:complete
MEDVVDLIATDASASDISDKMKEILYAKAAERIDIARPYVANAMFGQEFEDPTEDETESEVTDEPAEEEPSAELETETETDTEEESE